MNAYLLPVGNLCHPRDVNAPEVQQRLQQSEALCRERGLPLTVQRRDTLRVVLERDDHSSADQVFEAVRDRIPNLSRTTVCRVLNTLGGRMNRGNHHGPLRMLRLRLRA